MKGSEMDAWIKHDKDVTSLTKIKGEKKRFNEPFFSCRKLCIIVFKKY